MADNAGSSWGEIRSYCDKVMLFVTIVLFGLGVAAVYSASSSMSLSTAAAASFTTRQLMWGAVAAVVYVFILKIGYRKIIAMAVPLFVLLLVMLILLLIVGHTSKGAQSWFNMGFLRVQPSEPGKVIFALVMARLCIKIPPVDIKGLCSALLLAGCVILLILIQPDLGSSLVYSVMLIAVLITAGTPLKYLARMGVAGLSLLPVGWMVLKPYQRMRLLVFIDPSADPQGAGYNVIQSRIAVGSGGLFGKGFMHGTQGKLHFLPEPHTDFIFSVFSEEFGFIGCTFVLILFAVLLWKILKTAQYTKDPEAKVMIAAIAAWLWFQITESVAMSMGLAPVTGLPLPLFSYGGSSLLAVAAGLALVQSVAVVERADRF